MKWTDYRGVKAQFTKLHDFLRSFSVLVQRQSEIHSAVALEGLGVSDGTSSFAGAMATVRSLCDTGEINHLRSRSFSACSNERGVRSK